MTSQRLLLCCLLAALGQTLQPAYAVADDRPSVLMVVSSEGRDAGETRPGFEMDELAQAWAIFHDNGLVVTLASPRGGAVEADAFNARDPVNARLLADQGITAQLRATRKLDAVDRTGYDAVFVVGGKGAMFDLATDATLRRLLGQVHDAGGVIGAVCHGSAALVGAVKADGRPLVEGRTVTGFSAEEELLFGKRWSQQFPFVLERALRERGARWVEAPPMMPKLAVDGRLVTGQNPYSTGAVADALVRALGREPAPRTPHRDEASLALLQRAIDGDAPGAATALAAEPGRYHAELIGLIGHYQLQAALDEVGVARALVAMDLATPHFPANELTVSRAEAHWRLGRSDEARALLDRVLAAQPGFPEAVALLQRMVD